MTLERRHARVLGCALALAACAVVIACASGGRARPAATAPAPTELGRGATDPADLRAEIDALDRQIAAQLAQAQIPAPAAACTGAACTTAMAEPFTTPSAADPACHPAPSTRCSDACTLSGSICRDQQRICELAQKLPGDDWAAGKCTSARASCQAAHDSCCSCVL